MEVNKKKLKNKFEDISNGTKKIINGIGENTKKAINNSKDKIQSTMDINKDGHVDIEDVIVLGLRTPGIKINREDFLRKELMKDFSEETINKAIKETPVKAKIDLEHINKIADSVIQYERNCVSGISAALGTAGGLTMVASIPADIIQYYGYMLRATQKLMYLYGFPEINFEENNQKFDSETLNILIICFGVMQGVIGASNAIKAMAAGLSKGISSKIMSKALTKGTIYPIVKKVASFFGVKMTKNMLCGMVNKSLPIVGSVLSGGITYASFKPCCVKLQKSLQDTLLTNPNHVSTKEERDIIEAEFSYVEENKRS